MVYLKIIAKKQQEIIICASSRICSGRNCELYGTRWTWKWPAVTSLFISYIFLCLSLLFKQINVKISYELEAGILLKRKSCFLLAAFCERIILVVWFSRCALCRVSFVRIFRILTPAHLPQFCLINANYSRAPLIRTLVIRIVLALRVNIFCVVLQLVYMLNVSRIVKYI